MASAASISSGSESSSGRSSRGCGGCRVAALSQVGLPSHTHTHVPDIVLHFTKLPRLSQSFHMFTGLNGRALGAP
eukprot:40379-Chlamydomonas_euryale.AAC.3